MDEGAQTRQVLRARLAELAAAADPQVKERRFALKMEVNKRVGQIAASSEKTVDVVRAVGALPTSLAICGAAACPDRCFLAQTSQHGPGGCAGAAAGLGAAHSRVVTRVCHGRDCGQVCGLCRAVVRFVPHASDRRR